MKDEINFVLDEKLNELNSEIENVLYSLKEPLAGERIYILNKFTKELIKAHIKKSGRTIKKHQSQEAFILTTNEEEFLPPEFDFPDQETEAFEIPTFPIEPTRNLSEESLSVQPRDFQIQKIIEEPKKEIIKPIEKPKPLEITEEHVPLITSQVTGEEMASATVKGMFYIVNESKLEKSEITMLNSLKPLVEKKQNLFQDKEKFTKIMNKLAKKNKIASNELSPSKLRYFLIKHLVNFGLIDPILHDPKVTKITCDGPNLKIKVQRDNTELISNLEYINAKQLSDFVNYLAEKSSQKIKEETTTLDIEFESFRIHITVGTEGLPSKYILEKTI
ncbi:hypothetical protein HOF78_02965 [Candidatus Woesearchaeota archaeon]|nr:hypothetical protein [Candidatus Woesearchaeota archaeon]MBT6044495.1 hypothetical protein [Candidatus Woesearchaeota archaeon]